MLTQELMASLLGTGGRCWVIDSGRSYEHACRLFGGTLEPSKDGWRPAGAGMRHSGAEAPSAG